MGWDVRLVCINLRILWSKVVNKGRYLVTRWSNLVFVGKTLVFKNRDGSVCQSGQRGQGQEVVYLSIGRYC